MSTEKKKHKVRRKRFIIPLTILVVLIIARLLLPYFLKKYVNKTLDNIPGYMGHVEDIDVALYRGAYVIDGLILRKLSAQTDTPVLDFEKSDISIEWKSLFKGKVVSEIILHNPKFNYIFEDQQKEPVEGEPDVDDWTDALTSLVPIDINHLNVHNGTANFVQLSASPEISMFLEQINLDATNLSNVVNEEEVLPSNLYAKAISIGGGDVTISGNLNLLKEIPDMDIEASIRKADVTKLNDLIKNFAGVDFESGTFELYSEIAIADGYIKGYLKPMFINTKILGKEEDENFFGKLWEGFVGALKFVFKNQSTDTLATRAPIEGDLNKPDTSIWTTVLNIFKNAWIEAFRGQVDKDIEFEDAAKAN
ncbi:DUF748 domain-containing protein [Antarcticibacterium sp. 1MA-6-2]|uniref:DUF748 domain-containing protein n=1 Tax=Antarcticibacterium sp. 1MA-6-2 TaxID=2908210 RepID=UPI001F44CE1D|nr:DUF748 domain-containing protein [Antarcticibacterium sp. 1MA-6-2]UJH91171.1 DUF748 domain-containing protein [Antarcticibacterium sp. 1MA-6-2]